MIYKCVKILHTVKVTPEKEIETQVKLGCMDADGKELKNSIKNKLQN